MTEVEKKRAFNADVKSAIYEFDQKARAAYVENNIALAEVYMSRIRQAKKLLYKDV